MRGKRLEAGVTEEENEEQEEEGRVIRSTESLYDMPKVKKWMRLKRGRIMRTR